MEMEKTTGFNNEIVAVSSGRLDMLLAAALGCSRAYAQKVIRAGGVTTCGNRVKAITKTGYQVNSGERFLVTVPEARTIALEAEDVALDIIYEDADLLVLNKPAGMIVHPVAHIRSKTLVNALLQHCGKLSQIGGCIRPGIVHRLDKDTSGVMVVAKNDRAHQMLARQFEKHEIKKTYLALVHGVMEHKTGSIDAAIGRGQEDRTRMKVAGAGGRQAKTGYEVVKQYPRMALLRIFPETGRTHQIRVHLSYVKHPILGDTKYGRERAEEEAGRQMLHAESLTFRHPASQKTVTFNAPRPADFQEVIAAHEIH